MAKRLNKIEERLEYINDRVTELVVWRDEFEKYIKAQFRWIKTLIGIVIAILLALLQAG